MLFFLICSPNFKKCNIILCWYMYDITNMTKKVKLFHNTHFCISKYDNLAIVISIFGSSCSNSVYTSSNWNCIFQCSLYRAFCCHVMVRKTEVCALLIHVLWFFLAPIYKKKIKCDCPQIFNILLLVLTVHYNLPRVLKRSSFDSVLIIKSIFDWPESALKLYM